MLKNFGNLNRPTNIENEKSQSTVLLITGTLGAGKTTYIRNTLETMTKEEAENCILIINDVGSQNIDASRLKSDNQNMDITAISGKGCICCWDAESFEQILIELKEKEKQTGIAKNIIIEPSGIAKPEEMNAILKRNGFQPINVNCLNPLYLQNNSPEKTPDTYDIYLQNLIKKNADYADIILLTNTWDYLTEETKGLLDRLTTGKITITIPKWTDFKENITGKEWDVNIFRETYDIIKNIKPRVKTIFSQTQEKWWEEIPVSSEDFPISRYKLVNLVKVFGKYLIRAKGTLDDNKEFNVSFWGNIDIQRIPKFHQDSHTYNIPENKQHQFNFIFRPDTPTEIINQFKTILHNSEAENKDYYEKYFWSAGIPTIPKTEDYNSKIQELIYQYNTYANMENYLEQLDKETETLNNIKDELEKAEQTKINEKNRIKTKQEMKILWDNMKYDNPIIWMQYKNQAYTGENKIATIWDFKKHCFKSLTYICGKRLDFFAKNFKNKFGIDIYKIDPNLSFDDFLEKYSSELEQICQDEKFMNLWLRYEYFTVWEKTAKWENYRRSKKFYELNLK